MKFLLEASGAVGGDVKGLATGVTGLVVIAGRDVDVIVVEAVDELVVVPNRVVLGPVRSVGA